MRARSFIKDLLRPQGGLSEERKSEKERDISLESAKSTVEFREAVADVGRNIRRNIELIGRSRARARARSCANDGT